MIQTKFLLLHQHNDNGNEFCWSLPLSYAFQVNQAFQVAMVRIHSPYCLLVLEGRDEWPW